MVEVVVVVVIIVSRAAHHGWVLAVSRALAANVSILYFSSSIWAVTKATRNGCAPLIYEDEGTAIIARASGS